MFVASSSAALMLLLSFPLATAINYNVSAIFIFGDSLADAGNNNFIANATDKANFPPYGETFFHRPTGRFSNGRTAFDFIANELGLPFPPPYLKPGSDFSHGINFASGGSGLLDSTGKSSNIIPLSLQIRQFANYSSSHYAKEYLSQSLYVISIGGNDIGNYLKNTTFQMNTSAPDFVQLLLSTHTEYLLSLYNNGARNFLVPDIGPVRCTPNSRLAGMKAYNGGCLEIANQLAVAYNDGLTQLIDNLNKQLNGATILLAHVYDFVSNIIQHGESYGFKNTTSACCGAGPFNTAVSCGLEIPTDKRGEYTAFLCKPPGKYVFWDGTHTTEKVYRMVYQQIWGGNTSFITPFDLKSLLRKH